MNEWLISSGVGASVGVDVFEGIANNFVLTDPNGRKLSATFVGAGASVGGPVSATYADNDTPSQNSPIVWRCNAPGAETLLRYPSDGFIAMIGGAPRHLLTPFIGPVLQGVTGRAPTYDDISGGYIMIVGFGATSLPTLTGVGAIQDIGALSTILADIQFGKSKGYLISGISAYAVIAAAAKGVDIMSASAMTGKWLFI